MTELLDMDEPRRRIAALMSGLDIHDDLGRLVTVPGRPKDDLAPGTLNSILKQAGLKRR